MVYPRVRKGRGTRERAGSALLPAAGDRRVVMVYRRGKRKEWGWDVLAALGLPAG